MIFKHPHPMMDLVYLRQIQDAITMPKGLRVFFGDCIDLPSGRTVAKWLQIRGVFQDTNRLQGGGQVEQYGRKYRLSLHMTRSEVVQTIFRATLDFMEHEIREEFKYRGVAIFQPHRDVDALVEFALLIPPDSRQRLNASPGVAREATLAGRLEDRSGAFDVVGPQPQDTRDAVANPEPWWARLERLRSDDEVTGGGHPYSNDTRQL